MPVETFVATPTMVQLVKGNERLVVDSTVKEAPGLLVKANWITPLASSCRPVKIGGVPMIPCVMGIAWPSTVMVAVRLEPLLAVKEKLITPSATPPIVSHAWSLAGANGASKFTVAGNTAGRKSVPAAAV